MSKVEDLKLKNSEMMKECFYNTHIWTKNELSNTTGISKSAITNILKDLINIKMIEFIGEAQSTGGRKSKQYRLNKDYFHIGKIVLQRKKDRYYFIGQSVNLFNQIIVDKQIISKQGTYQELVELIQELITNDTSISTICLSIPGICENGFISDCDFEELRNMELKKLLSDLLHKEIIIENDVNVAVIALHHRYTIANLALLYQPEVEYVGCGMIIANQLYNGYSHFAGELRYLPFYNHQIQREMLNTHPKELLRLQIETICCVMNPEMICLYSDVLNETELQSISLQIPKQHQPRIQVIQELNMYLYEGLYDIAMNNLKDENHVH